LISAIADLLKLIGAKYHGYPVTKYNTIRKGITATVAILTTYNNDVFEEIKR